MSFLPVCLSAQTGGRVSGAILSDETGAPIVGATVVAVQQSSNFGKVGPAIFRSTTELDGSYAIANVPSGDYLLCLYEAGDYLDPCQWGPATNATIATGTTSLDIRVRKGVRLAVRVGDAENLVAQYKKSSPDASAIPGAFIRITVTDTQGKMRTLPLTYASERLYEYSTLVPPDTDLTLNVSSSFFMLADQSDNPIGEQGYSAPLRLSIPKPPDPRIRLPFAFLDRRATVIPVKIRAAASGAP